MFSRDAMKDKLARGRSVFYKGRIITSEAELPSAAELAQGDPVAEARTRDDLQGQIAELQRQVALLGGNQQASQQPLGSNQQPSGGNQQPASTPLPDTFPFAVQLRNAGYTTREQVAKATDKQLDTVEGIDREGVRQIRAALEV